MTNPLWARFRECPFCGGTNIQLSEGTTFRWRYVGCSECGAQIEFRSDNRFEPTDEAWQDAAEEWNRRAQSDERAAAIEEGMVLVPHAALDRIMRDCEHGSRIWKECDALLRTIRLAKRAAERAAPVADSTAGELVERLRKKDAVITGTILAKLAHGEGTPEMAALIVGLKAAAQEAATALGNGASTEIASGGKSITAQRDKLKAVNAELLAALDTLVDALDGNHLTIGDTNQARAALDRAKKEA